MREPPLLHIRAACTRTRAVVFLTALAAVSVSCRWAAAGALALPAPPRARARFINGYGRGNPCHGKNPFRLKMIILTEMRAQVQPVLPVLPLHALGQRGAARILRAPGRVPRARAAVAGGQLWLGVLARHRRPDRCAGAPGRHVRSIIASTLLEGGTGFCLMSWSLAPPRAAELRRMPPARGAATGLPWQAAALPPSPVQPVPRLANAGMDQGP